jgi:HNH endonuclease
MCKTHYNKSMGCYIGDMPKDPARERARLRLKTHRRKDWSRLTDITPEYEQGLRAKAKRCPLCTAKLTDEPYLPNSKELDHIVPQGAGGTHTIGNVRIICRACNLARPWDGSDYTGPVTLWSVQPGFVQPPESERECRPRCEHGIPSYYRCHNCQPLLRPHRETRAQVGS